MAGDQDLLVQLGGTFSAVTGGLFSNGWIKHQTAVTKFAMLTAAQVEKELRRQLAHAQSSGLLYIDIKAGDLHQDAKGRARVPLVCHVMRKLMVSGDRVLHEPPSGQSTTVVIRYVLPRWGA